MGTSGSVEAGHLYAARRMCPVLYLSSEQAACDAMDRIPVVGRSDSLNLAVARGKRAYTSGCVLSTRTGALEGSAGCRAESG